MYAPSSLPNPMPPQAPWTARGPTAAAVAHCRSGGLPRPPRTAPGPTAAAVAHCCSGSPLPSSHPPPTQYNNQYRISNTTTRNNFLQKQALQEARMPYVS